MTLNGSGVLDIARVLHVSPATVIRELKKSPQLESIKSAAVADNTTRTCGREISWWKKKHM